MGRVGYEVKVRIKLGSDNFKKKSFFFRARSSKEAASKYKGSGSIISVEKVKKERVLGGVGDFFRLGDTLLKELRAEDSLRLQDTEKRKEKIVSRKEWKNKLTGEYWRKEYGKRLRKLTG